MMENTLESRWKNNICGSKSKHNDKMGKYSFDKFGNLVPYRECTNALSQKNSNQTKNESSVDIEIEIDLFSNLDFSVFGGMSSPFGENIDMYDPAPHFGLESKLGNFILTLGLSSFEYEKEITGENDVIFYRKNTLSSTDITWLQTEFKVVCYSSLGMFNRSYEASGLDLDLKPIRADLGVQRSDYNFTVISIFAM